MPDQRGKHGSVLPTSWDAIRTAVRRHRAEQPHAHAFAVPRDFVFDDAAGRVYFLALETVNASAGAGINNGGAPVSPRATGPSPPRRSIAAGTESPLVSPTIPSPPRYLSSSIPTSGSGRTTRPRAQSAVQMPGNALGGQVQQVRTWSIFYASLKRPVVSAGDMIAQGYSRRRRKSYADVAAAFSRVAKGNGNDSDEETADNQTSRTESRNTTLIERASAYDERDEESVFGGYNMGS